MSTTARTAGLLAAFGGSAALLLGGAAPAYADSYTPTLDASNWYWASQYPAPAPAPVPGSPVALPDQASGIPAGDLGVAYINSNDKVAALQIGVASVPIGATFTSFVLKMHIDGNMVSTSPAALSACELLDAFSDAPGPSAWASAPTASSASCANGVYDAASATYSFQLATVATDWAGGTPVSGVLVEPAVGTSAPFNYAFDKKSITMTATYTATPATVTAPVVAPPPPFSPPNQGIVSFPAPALQPLPSLVNPVPAAAPAPAPQTAPVPVAVTPAAAGLPLPVNALRPDGTFWLGGLVLALLLLAVSYVLGDPLAPVPLDARRRRFAEVVKARAAARPTAAPATPRASHGRARPA